MSTFSVRICEISEVTKHPEADRLDIVKLTGMDWNVVTQKDKYIVGSKVIYFPIDSVLPESVESVLFPPDAKVKLNNSRIRTIKLRKAISQGMVADPSLFDLQDKKVGTDVTNILGVTKYEPIVKGPSFTQGKSSVQNSNPHFRKYTGIENAKNYNNIFNDDDEVFVTEKIHGTNFRAGYVPFYADSLWKKFLKLIKLAPSHDFVYGSHNRQLQSKLLYKGYYDTNVYAEAVVKYQLKIKLNPGEVIYGEIIGDGIQKGYTYGCKPGERKLVCFEVKVNDEWLDPIAAKKFIEERGLEFVPVLYKGPFNKEKILELRDGDSVYAPSQKVREGVVVRSMQNETSYIGRKILKFISDTYLLKNQDDETLAH